MNASNVFSLSDWQKKQQLKSNTESYASYIGVLPLNDLIREGHYFTMEVESRPISMEVLNKGNVLISEFEKRTKDASSLHHTSLQGMNECLQHKIELLQDQL